jgi:RNA polymerase sigma-70 factor (ECF subfamily)
VVGSKHLPGSVYDPKICAFKTWLLNLSAWRIKNQLRRRHRHPSVDPAAQASAPQAADDETGRTSMVDRIPDPDLPDFGAEWDRAYDRHVFGTALERVRGKFDPKAYQVFDLYVLKE